jgi:hypothetical protein
MVTATRLNKLFIEEVSGVDDPANQLPGFMVMKARRGSAWERVVKACDDLRKELGNDDTFERVLKAMFTEGERVFLGHDSLRVLKVVRRAPSLPAGVEVIKRHSLRHPTDGQFTPAMLGPFRIVGGNHLPALLEAAARSRRSAPGG